MYGLGWGSAKGIGSRAIFGRGFVSGQQSVNLDYVTIETTGNAGDFGDLISNPDRSNGQAGSTTRGVFSSVGSNTYQYVTFATIGNATDFGDARTTTIADGGSSSNETRQIVAYGWSSIGNTYSNIIDYLTIATTGNSVSFGNLTNTRGYCTGASSTTRALNGGGYTGTFFNTIDYVTIATTGNATDFGDLLAASYAPGSCTSSTRAVFVCATKLNGGHTATNILEYVTMASTGNSTDFGDLDSTQSSPPAASNKLRGVIAGGYATGAVLRTDIRYITIATTGNTTDFGDLLEGKYSLQTVCNNHGGIA